MKLSNIMTIDSQNNNKENSEINLLEWFIFFWNNKLIIVFSCIFSVAYSFYVLSNAEAISKRFC